MNKLIILSIFVMGASAIVWCAFILPGKGVYNNSTKTIIEITQIINDSKLWSSEDIKQYGALPCGELDTLSLNRKVASLFKSCHDNAIHSGSLVSSDGLFRDGWGEPLIFISTNNPIYGRINPELKNSERPFVVLSVGPNHTNELGYGDDLFSHL